MMAKTKLALIAIGLALSILVWPTRFRYDSLLPTTPQIIKTDRFTGCTYRLSPHNSKGWAVQEDDLNCTRFAHPPDPGFFGKPSRVPDLFIVDPAAGALVKLP